MAMPADVIDSHLRRLLQSNGTLAGGLTWDKLRRSLPDVDQRQLEGRLAALKASHEVLLACGVWSLTHEHRDPPPPPDHRRIPQTSAIAHMPSSEMAQIRTPPVNRVRHQAPAEDAVATVIEEPPMSIECKRCGVKKPPGDMVLRSGNPSKLCRDCFRTALTGKPGGKAKRNGQAESPPPAKASPALREIADKVKQRVANPYGSTIADLRARRAELEVKLQAIDQGIAALELLG